MKKILLFFLFLAHPAWSAELRVVGLEETFKKGDGTLTETIQGLNALGITSTLHQIQKLVPSHLTGVKLLHLETSSLSNGIYIEKSLQMAQSLGAKISLTVSEPNYIEHFRERILALIEAYTDILFLKEDEAFALTLLPPERAAAFLSGYAPIIVVQTLDEGCWVSSFKEHFYAKPKQPALMNVGAFQAAFLYAYLNGYSLKTCAEFGNLAGRTIQPEKELSAVSWESVKKNL